MRKPAALLPLAVAAVLLAACGAPARGPLPADRAPSVGPATGMLAAGETLPIAAYEFTPGQLKVASVAYVKLVNRCMAADGTVRSYGGADVPAGGCEGDAKRQLTAGGGYYGPPELPGRIDADGFEQSLDDPAVRAGFAAWSACMANDGRSYPDPLAAAGDKRWSTPEPTTEEIATARADLACKRSTGLVPTWLHAEQRLEQSAIDRNIAELTAVRSGVQTSVRTADAIAEIAPTAP